MEEASGHGCRRQGNHEQRGKKSDPLEGGADTAWGADRSKGASREKWTTQSEVKNASAH